MSTTVNIHEAKTHLSRLVAQAASGQEVIIAKSGHPLVMLVPVAPQPTSRRLGFMAGLGCIDADLKGDFSTDIEAMFPR